MSITTTTEDGEEHPDAPLASADRLPDPAPVTRTTSGRPRRLMSAIALLLLVVALGVLVLRPLEVIQRRALHGGYHDAFTDPNMAVAIRTTIYLAIVSLAIALVLGTMLAWFAFQLPRRLRWMAAIPALPIVIPGPASVMGLIFLFSPRIGYGNALLRHLPWWKDLTTGPVNVYSLPWIVIHLGVSLSALVYLFVSAGLGAVNAELMESAEVCGSSRRQVFVRVTLPLLRPSLVYATAICTLLALGQFVGPLLLGTTANVRVLTTLMFQYLNTSPINFNAAAAIGACLTIVGLLFIVGQRALLGDHHRFVTHGGKAFRPPGRRSRGGAAFIAVYGLLAAVLPLIAIFIVAVSPRWTSTIAWHDLTLAHFRTTWDSTEFQSAFHNTVKFSLLSAFIVVPIGFACASILIRGRRFRAMRTTLDFLVQMPLGIPGIVFGLGFLFAYNGPPIKLYGSDWVFIVVYVTLMLPFVTRLQISGMVALGSQYIEGSRTAGAGELRTNAQIVLPLMRPALGATLALTVIILSQEFAASLLVRSPTTNVLGTLLYDSYNLGTYSEVAVIAVMMTALTTVGLAIAVSLGGGGALRRL